ncbi:MAG: hypothetical protein Q8Q09_20590, partial [Deltaproteobacteria bacterium]|nr:hypothetical protein [Deltaproteobacteria bacterium]
GNVARERMLAKALLHSFRQGKHAGHSCGMYAIARTRPSGAKGRPFSASTTTANAAQFELKSWEESGQVKWLHWVDERLATAWAHRAAQQLAAVETRFGSDDADATWFESVRSEDSLFMLAIKEALQSLVFAHSALDLPTLIEVQYRGKSHPLVQSRVSYNPEARLRVHTVIDGLSAFRPVARAWLDSTLSQATSRVLGSRELDPDRSVVVDVLTRREVEQGSFEHAQRWIAQQPANTRARYAWRGRRPWSLLGYDANDFQFEYESGPALWTQRSAWLDNVRRLRHLAARIEVNPWGFVGVTRSRIAAYNRKLARDWSDAAGLTHPGTDPAAIAAFFEVVQDLANQKSERDLLRSRSDFVSGMRANSATVGAIAGAVSSGVGALMMALTTEFFAFLVGAIPRDWLAIGETLPPPLPLPFLLDGEEKREQRPSLAVPAPPGYSQPQLSLMGLAPVEVASATHSPATPPAPRLAVEPSTTPVAPVGAMNPLPTLSNGSLQTPLESRQLPFSTMPETPSIAVRLGMGLGAVSLGGMLVWIMSQHTRRRGNR